MGGQIVSVLVMRMCVCAPAVLCHVMRCNVPAECYADSVCVISAVSVCHCSSLSAVSSQHSALSAAELATESTLGSVYKGRFSRSELLFFVHRVLLSG